MGKKKTKIDKHAFNRGLMNFAGDTGGSKEAKELLERYNVEGYRSHKAGRSGTDYRGFDDVKRDLERAMMNDYDTRRSIEAAAMSGNKDAKKFAEKGIKGAKGMVGAYDLLKDLKKEHVGGGGMNGAKNRAGLTHALVQADRENLSQSYRDEFASKTALEEMQNKIKAEATSEPYTPSPELTQARAQEDEYTNQLTSFGDLISGSKEDEAQDFKDKYSANVAGGLKLSGIKTRGPESGIRPGEGF